MPTYEYKCTKCGHRFEIFQSMKDEPLTTCPVCKGKIKRLIGAGAGPIFKGTGFYQTDYKNPSNSKTSNSKTNNQSTNNKTASDKKSDIKSKNKE
ncbi:MAG TPA: zinc ribbon domain-containing protein [Ignavibacteriaceae bacterium]|nr:MAG: Zinc ribbon domain protein [Ignavibacteria bacterium ADurb.Bin266]OQY71591.1 MAG: FmdB family transcriptional regulator [Ignavibacteriales bacterium UTCHB2]HQF41467.1 zinc ribbon domain-containing protein [Ignavibacteriaceae bacterium]HQI42013.1 zinc ribbon domain-containing protein [Ignavibacteriaceae bacterium]HQJ46430.1 zinc ribbon domain-containing protein [Ignavibacteriaceae bacterium]